MVRHQNFLTDPTKDGFICPKYELSQLTDTDGLDMFGPDWLTFLFHMIPKGSNILDVYGTSGKTAKHEIFHT